MSLRLPSRRFAIVGVLALLLLSAVGAAGLLPLGLPSAVGAPNHVTMRAPSAGPTPAKVTAASGFVASGPGQFYNSTPLPLPVRANRTCLEFNPPGGYCANNSLLNVTNNVATNYTSAGVLAVAYTAMTNASPCGTQVVKNNTQSEVMFVRSTNNGQSWSSPLTLGEPNCKIASAYPDAWDPAITSLTNGTLVLVYVEFNSSFLLPYLDQYYAPASRLVVSESYTGGTTWTEPMLLNLSTDPSLIGISFPQLRPTVAAFGNTVYVSWMTMDEPANFPNPGARSAVSVLISTNGGADWSPVIPVASSLYEDYGNPNLLVNGTGVVYLAYAGGLPYSGLIWVAVSSDNFTSWSTNLAAFASSEPLLGPFALTAPKLAWNALYNELYLAFAQMTFTCPPLGFCGQVSVPALYTSTNGGSSWSSSFAAGTSIYDPSEVSSGGVYTGSPYSLTGVYDVEIAVNGANNLEMMAEYENGSRCVGLTCGYFSEVVVNTSNNGTSFTGPFDLNGTLTYGGPGWPGEYSSVVMASGHTWFAWSHVTCPTLPASGCSSYPNAPIPQSQVTITMPFTGTGVTLTFTATGLNSTTPWMVNVMGNVRIANGTNSLVVTGVPKGWTIDWYLPGTNNTSQFRFYVVGQSTFPTVVLSASLVDTVSFHEYVPFGVFITPTSFAQPSLYLPQCAQIYQYNFGSLGWEWIAYITCVSVNITPWPPGTITWVPYGVPIHLGVGTTDILGPDCESKAASTSPKYFDIFCEVTITNLSFLSWTGAGPGGVSSAQPNITVTPLGAVNETGNFYNTASCSGYYDWYMGHLYEVPACENITTSLAFDEKGLPAGTNWGVSVNGPNGFNTAQQSTLASATVANLDVATLYTIEPWTIPTANPALFWVATCSVGASVVTPQFTPVFLNYTLESLTGLSFNLTVQEAGLPGGTLWTYSVDSASENSSYGLTTASVVQTLPAGINYSVNASFITGSEGSGYELTGVSYFVDTVNGTSYQNVSLPATFDFTGFTNVTFWYTQAWWLSVSATAHGHVSPGSEWVGNASGVVLTATPDPGYIFVGWSGSGPGSTSSAQRHSAVVAIHPTGPVTEIASFAPRPNPTWSISVSANGIPSTQPYTVQLGTGAFTGVGSFAITNLTTGNYSLGAPYVYDNTTVGVRYLPGAPSSSLVLTGNLLDVNGNGTITLQYATQYLLTVSGTAGGTVSPSGTTWENSGAQQLLTASPLTGYSFTGWNGTGTGARSSKSLTVTVVIGGVISEAAQFSAIPPPPPATYSLTVSESGLPTAASWGLAVGSSSASGSGALTVAGLNGTYTLSVPTVYTTAGVRYVPNGSLAYSASVPVTSGNANWTVSFVEQVLVTLQTSGQGTLTGSSGWVGYNTPIQLVATPGTGWQFAGWSGTGPGATNANGSTSTTITPTGPVVETATFTPSPPAATQTGSSSAGLTTAVVLLVVLLVAGLAVGMLLARRRRRAPPAPEPMESWQETPSDAESPPMDSTGLPPGSS